jgi:hypothetical protein
MILPPAGTRTLFPDVILTSGASSIWAFNVAPANPKVEKRIKEKSV